MVTLFAGLPRVYLPFAFTIIQESGTPVLIYVDLPIPCIIVNANGRDQNGVGLGPRLVYWMAKKKNIIKLISSEVPSELVNAIFSLKKRLPL